VPASGVCYASSMKRAYQLNPTQLEQTPCTQSHVVETYHVGQFPAEVTRSPEPGDPNYSRAFEGCESAAKDLLGGEWYGGRLNLAIALPDSSQWDAGGHWYRCELMETKTFEGDELVARDASLAGALAGAAPVAQKCADMVRSKPNTWDDLAPVDCAQSHDAEYVGGFKAPGTDYPTQSQRDALFEGCADAAAKFAGGTKDRMRIGSLTWFNSPPAWKKGDHWVRCYAWAGEHKKMVGTVKGIGNGAPHR
jgi:Septum formation